MISKLLALTSLAFTVIGISSTASAVSCIASFDDIDHLVLDNTDGRVVTRTIEGSSVMVNTIRVREGLQGGNACEMTLHMREGNPSRSDFPPSPTRTFKQDADNIRFVWVGFDDESDVVLGIGPRIVTTIAGSCTCVDNTVIRIQ